MNWITICFTSSIKFCSYCAGPGAITYILKENTKFIRQLIRINNRIQPTTCLLYLYLIINGQSQAIYTIQPEYTVKISIQWFQEHRWNRHNGPLLGSDAQLHRWYNTRADCFNCFLGLNYTNIKPLKSQWKKY
jgi:hypothetical protein